MRERIIAKVRKKPADEKPEPAIVAYQIAKFFGILKGLPEHKVRTETDNILKRAKREGTEHELEQDLEGWLSNFSPDVFFGKGYLEHYTFQDRKEYVELLGIRGLARAASSFPESPDDGTFEYLKFSAENTSGAMGRFALSILAHSAYLLNRSGDPAHSQYVEGAKRVLHNEIGPLSEELNEIIDGKARKPLSRPHAYAMLAVSLGASILSAFAHSPLALLSALPGAYALHSLSTEPFTLQGFFNRVSSLMEQKGRETEL